MLMSPPARERTPWSVERIKRARARGWASRYVAHFGHYRTLGCHYGSACRIANEQNRLDARLSGLQAWAERQETLGL